MKKMNPMKKTVYYNLSIILFLGLFDLSLNVFTKTDIAQLKKFVSFKRYFEYGRSTEAKMEKMLSGTDTTYSQFVNWAWAHGNVEFDNRPKVASSPSKVLIALYGMSHTKLLGEAIEKIDSSFEVRDITAPGAPANWSYYMFQTDLKKHFAKIAIFGIMTDIVPLITTTSGSTLNFDMGYPFTYPRYIVTNNDSLKAINPPFSSAATFMETFHDYDQWEQYRTWLSKNDNFYDPITFIGNITDQSVIINLMRRSYAVATRNAKMEKVYRMGVGFNKKSEAVAVLRCIVRDFAATAWENNIIPIIYIVNNPGGSNYLYEILKPVLDAHSIPYLSTDKICPPNDPSLFLHENRHFVPSKDIELAHEMIKVIKKTEKQYNN